MTRVQFRSALAAGEVQHRFYPFEFRANGDGDEENREFGGVAMRYGDVAELPWGEKEKFEPRAFGDLVREDILMDQQHDRNLLLARTGAGLKITDSRSELRIDVDMPRTPTGDAALAMVRENLLRGFSVAFIPVEWRYDENERTTTIERADLKRVSLVDIPAYPQAKVDRRAQMDEKQIRELVNTAIGEALKERSGDQIDADELASAVAKAVEPQIREQVDSAIEARAAAEQATAAAEAAAAEERAAAEQARAAAETAAEEARAAAEQAKTDAEAAIEQAKADATEQAHQRAELLVLIAPLVDDDAETRGMTSHELLVLAVGDEIDDSAERSEDYLTAKVEDILARRKAAEGNGKKVTERKRSSVAVGGRGPINVLNMPRPKATASSSN